MSYDASYPQFNLAGKYRINEKQLPFAHFSISDCYRNEQSGECMLLFRGKRFNMPDIHPYFKNLDDAWEWYPKIEKQIEAGFDLAKREYVNVAKVGSEKSWEICKKNLCSIARNGKKEMLIEIKMDKEDRYWIVDIDYSFIDAFGQVREIGCIQIDIGNAKRLGIKYHKDDGGLENPVIIHCAIPGGIERYIYMLIDNMQNFPIYFRPIQLRLIPVSQKYNDYALKIAESFPQIRIDIDDRSEGVSQKIKQAHADLVPNHLVIGEKEVAEGEIPQSAKDAISNIQEQIKGLPSIPVQIPLFLSKAL
jgi:threonyl-tRNA synthetase